MVSCNEGHTDAMVSQTLRVLGAYWSAFYTKPRDALHWYNYERPHHPINWGRTLTGVCTQKALNRPVG